MSHLNHWFNYQASLKILIFGLILGSGLPALFALAVRVGAAGDGVIGSDGAAVAQKNPALTAISYAHLRVGPDRGDYRRVVHRPGIHRSAYRHVHSRRQARVKSEINLY